jgi:hypothetical protein
MEMEMRMSAKRYKRVICKTQQVKAKVKGKKRRPAVRDLRACGLRN